MIALSNLQRNIRLVGTTAAILFALIGFVILLAFSGPVYIEPQFEQGAQMLMGFGLILMFGGLWGTLLLIPNENWPSSSARDLQILNILLSAVMMIACWMAISGAVGHFTT